jgi:hypothetical protein
MVSPKQPPYIYLPRSRRVESERNEFGLKAEVVYIGQELLLLSHHLPTLRWILRSLEMIIAN